MIDARVQVYEGLSAVFGNVKHIRPETNITLPLVVYQEVTHTATEKWREEVDFQVDIYAADFEDLIDLVQEAEAVMSGIGFTLTYTSPDTDARVDRDLYKKALNYHGRIDTYHERFMKE